MRPGARSGNAMPPTVVWSHGTQGWPPILLAEPRPALDLPFRVSFRHEPERARADVIPPGRADVEALRRARRDRWAAGSPPRVSVEALQR